MHFDSWGKEKTYMANHFQIYNSGDFLSDEQKRQQAVEVALELIYAAANGGGTKFDLST